MSEVIDKRSDLINEICMWLTTRGIDAREAQDMLYVLANDYEITSRSTEIAVLKEDRNDYLLKKFIIAKTVKGCSKKTLHAYKNGLVNIFRTIGKTVDDITADDIRYYLAMRQARDRISKVYADNELRYLRTFYQYLVADELVTKNPTLKVDRIKCERRRKEAFTEIEVEKIRLNVKGEREKAIIEVLLSTGCRVTELVNIELNDIDGNKVLVHGKGAKDRTVYLNAKAEVAIGEYLKKRTDCNPYFLPAGYNDFFKKSGFSPSKSPDWWKYSNYVEPLKHLEAGTVEQMMRRIAKRAGIEKANPHKFRRTCATMALRRGMPIEQVSKMLGHEEIATTQIYLDLSEGELEQAHKKYVV